MKIHNLRVGFATNSSSSHSVVIIPDDMVGKVSDDPSGPDYGWEHFTLSSPEEKLRYLAAQMFSSFREVSDEHEAIRNDFVKVFGEYIEGYADCEHTTTSSYGEGENERHYLEAPYVDHQSAFNFQTYDETFLRFMIRHMMSKNVVVLGGNDNDGEMTPPKGAVPDEFFTEFIHSDHANDIIQRKDGENYSLFNRSSGKKIRFSFDPDVEYDKASAPELVDVKITDFCTKGCNFCYQSSTKEGMHAPLERIKAVFDMLSEMEVFEVALGGGEPTSHPDFAEILRYAHEKRIKPNFTTFTADWLENEEILEAVKQYVGGIGVSCLDAKGVEMAREIKKHFGWGSNVSVMAQHVVGSVPVEVTMKLIKEAGEKWLPILLLGYKKVGFGSHYNAFEPTDKEMAVVGRLILEQTSRGVSVDTALVDNYPKFIEVLGAPKALVSSPEGKFSCYVDAVTERMAASSYVEEEGYEPLASNVEEFKTAFAAY